MIRITHPYIPLLQKRPVAVMGAFRCGTNYLSYLLGENYHCRIVPDAYGWKHTGVPIRTRFHGRQWNITPIAVIAKNPFAFVEGLFRYRNAVGRNIIAPELWDAFLAEPIVLFDSHIKKSPQMKFANPVQYWNWIYWNLTSLPEGKYLSAAVSYPELVTDPEAVTAQMAQRFGLRRKAGAFKLPESRLKRGNSVRPGQIAYETGSAGAAAPLPAEGAEPHYMQVYSDSQTAFVRHEADPALLGRFGFNKLEVFQ